MTAEPDTTPIAGPPPRPSARDRLFDRLSWAVIAFGVLVRTRQYLGARSLRYDEARVAFEIAQRSLPEMLDAAGFIRVAPPGWFVLEKLSMMAFGTGELALRLVPFIAGILAMPLFWLVPRRYLGARVAFICVALAAVSEHVVFYASELKQYSSDVLWTLLVLIAVHPLLDRPGEKRGWVLAGVVGALAMWFSQTAIFVMGAAGIVLLVRALRDRTVLRRTVVLGATWVASVTLNYVFILSEQSGRGELINYWRQGFVPRGRGMRTALVWFYDRAVEYVEMPAGLYSFGLVLFITAVGLIALLRRRRDLGAIVALTFSFALLAAVLQQYPFTERLLLFSVPVFLLIVSAGIDQLDPEGGPRLLSPGWILLVLLMAQPTLRAVRMIQQPEGREEIKAAMHYVTERLTPDEAIYLGSGAYGAYVWYTTWTDQLRNPRDRTFQGSDVKVGADSIRAELAALKRFPRLWLVFVDYYDYDLQLVLQQMETMAERRDEFQATGAVAYLYEFRPDSTVAPDSAAVTSAGR